MYLVSVGNSQKVSHLGQDFSTLTLLKFESGIHHCARCPVHCRMVNSVHGLYPQLLVASHSVFNH